MLLRSVSGDSFELRVVRYQFDHAGPSAGGEYDDANWLVVRGALGRPDGTTFTFVEPCLLTHEARQIADWLGTVAEGRCPPTHRWDRDDPPSGMLTSIEPNLAWSVQEYTPGSAVVRVHLSAESSPPWAPGSAGGEFCQPLELRRDELAAAADEWGRELAPYPDR